MAAITQAHTSQHALRNELMLKYVQTALKTLDVACDRLRAKITEGIALELEVVSWREKVINQQIKQQEEISALEAEVADLEMEIDNLENPNQFNGGNNEKFITLSQWASEMKSCESDLLFIFNHGHRTDATPNAYVKACTSVTLSYPSFPRTVY